MDVFNIFKLKIIDIIPKLPLKIDNKFNFESIQLNPPKDSRFGDLTTNVALSLSRLLNINALEIAQLIADKLLTQEKELIKDIDIVNPGFINITLQPQFWHTILKHILKDDINCSLKKIGNNQKINIEYVSANPTGCLHIGHARGAVIGSILSNIYNLCGFDVTQEYYINDAGNQIKGLALSLYYRYCEYFNKTIEKPIDFYPGAYIKEAAEALIKDEGGIWLNKNEEEVIPYFSNFAISYMINLIKEDLLLLDIKHDVFTSEKLLVSNEAYEKLKNYLNDKNLIYKGILEPPKGHKSYKNTQESKLPCLIFKTTQFGDTIDRVLEKSDGTRTYFANDILYHENKIQRGFTLMIDILGVDHKGYEQRLKAAVLALSNSKAKLDILFTELVNLQKNSQPVKMSKRSGNFLSLKQVLKEVPKDVFRIIMISRSNNSVLDFDLAKAAEKNDKNPVYYIQYAYVRVNSVLNKFTTTFKNINIEKLLETSDEDLISNLHLLQSVNELELIKTLALYTKVLKNALHNNNVHLIFLFLMDISKSIHSLWSAGKTDSTLKFIIESNKELTFARVYLLLATKKIMTILFNIVGIDKPDLM